MANEEFDNILSIPDDIIFPDELNRYLREQITGFSFENAMLRKNLDESEQRIIQMENDMTDLKKKLKEVENPTLPSFSTSSQTINTKIVELSRNYREKCAELEKYKTKCSKLLCNIEELKKKEPEEWKKEERPKSNFIKPENETLNEIKQLQEKLNTTTNKMLEFKNLNMQLRNELRQANKLLQQEVGEDLNSLQGNSTWKGRAQIICDLQEKNRKLKEKLRNVQDHGAVAETPVINEKISSKIATLEKENLELKTQNDTFKVKLESLKSRCNMLETEHQELKLKMQNVKNQSDRDIELIADMSKKLAEAEHIKRNTSKEKDLEIMKLKMEIKNLLSQIENYKILVDNLKAKNEQPNNCNINNAAKEENDKKEQEHDKRRIQDLEEEKLNLVELINIYKKRLQTERSEHEKCQQLFRIEKQKAVKLEATVAKIELESPATHRSSYTSISQSSRTSEVSLKNQLELAEENIKVLQSRLNLEQNERKQDFQEFAKILSASKINK